MTAGRAAGAANAKTALAALALCVFALLLPAACGVRARTQFVTALDSDIVTLDPLNGTDATSSRLQQLIFNSLLRKNEKFEYVGDLAADYKVSDDGRAVTFTLRDGVTFHDGRPLTSADAKYTLDALLAPGSKRNKAAGFFETAPGGAAQPYITSVETPDPKTLVINLRKPWSSLLGNLVSVPVIPQGSADTQKDHPVGSGPFKFVRRDENQKLVDLAAFENYWQGAPQIKQLRVRTILDANTLQAELLSGRVDLVSGAANLSPDAFKYLGQISRLRVEQFPGANIVYLGFNCERPPLDNVKVRQAIAYAINRESLVRDLMLGQARVANSILPESSWAYDPGQQYPYDPARAKQLLDEAGFRDPDGDGPAMRFNKAISFKISAGNTAVSQYANVIQNWLKAVGVPVSIETYETSTLLQQLREGQFEMTTLRWVGGNQDPVFLRDLFHSSQIPTADRATVNRSRYRNPDFDRVIDEAVNTLDRTKAQALYAEAQQILSRDLPLLPLWYPSVIVVERNGVENVHVDPSGDFSFLRSVTVQQK
jgi:peptide/nickel transport system substrate-binding protein